MDTLGIDIGTASVKYVRMRGKGTIISQGEYPHRGGWEDLNFVLNEIKDKEGTDVEIAIAVSSQDIIKRTFTIPIMPRDEAKEAIEWSASKVATGPLEDMIYQNIVLGEISERGMKKEEILFVGANREYINILLSIFETVGFRRIVTITDSGILYLPITAERKEGPVAVIDIGGRQTGIYIFDDKRLRLIREILTASESFIDALMGEFDLSYEDAERHFIDKGISEESRQILSFPFDRLTSEVQRTFNVYTRKYPERPISKIYVTGKAARVPNLAAMMQDIFVEPVEHLPGPGDIEEHFTPSYALCIDTEPLFNLLPEKLKARKREMTLRSWLRIATICVVAFLLIPTITMVTNLRKTQILLKSEQADMASKKEQLRLLGSITSASRHGELAALKKELEKKDVTLVTLLQYFSSRLPTDIYLREIEFVDTGHKSRQVATNVPRDTATKDSQVATTPAGQHPSKPSLPDGAGTLHGMHDYSVTLRGYIFGDVQVLEAALLRLVIGLEQSALVREIQVSERAMKDLRGKNALEFTITGRCASYDI